VGIHKLKVAGTPVAVDSFIGGVATNSLIKLFNSSRERTSLEDLITFGFVLLSNLRVEVSLSFCFLLKFFATAERVLDSYGIVFEKCAFVSINSQLNFTFLFVGGALCGDNFSQFLEVIRALLSFSNSDVTLF
jgi:hypothetical protein